MEGGWVPLDGPAAKRRFGERFAVKSATSLCEDEQDTGPTQMPIVSPRRPDTDRQPITTKLRPRRWAPPGWDGNRWSARSIHPGGLETHHEPCMSSFACISADVPPTSTCRTTNTSTGRLSWLRPRNIVSTWEHLADVKRRADSRSFSGTVVVPNATSRIDSASGDDDDGSSPEQPSISRARDPRLSVESTWEQQVPMYNAEEVQGRHHGEITRSPVSEPDASIYHIVIVGAGAAGLSAARKLVTDADQFLGQGRRLMVTILEGKDRVGGRIHTYLMGSEADTNSRHDDGRSTIGAEPQQQQQQQPQ